LRRHRCAALPGRHGPLGIWARQSVLTKQLAVGLRQGDPRRKFAVLAVKCGLNDRLAHSERPLVSDAPHHKAWQGGCAGQFGWSLAVIRPA
jgi:hypothetical protein